MVIARGWRNRVGPVTRPLRPTPIRRLRRQNYRVAMLMMLMAYPLQELASFS